MEVDDFYITYKHFKVVNFYNKYPVSEKLDCDIADVDLLSQKEQQKNIEDKLRPLGISLTKIRGVRWRIHTGVFSADNPNRHLFIDETTYPDLYWYRYDTNTSGASGYILVYFVCKKHHIYYRKEKTTLYKFLRFTDTQLQEFLGLA